MREFRYVICDVFTDRPLEGNPLAVFYAKVEGTAAAIERVEVGGCAVTVARGEFRLPA